VPSRARSPDVRLGGGDDSGVASRSLATDTQRETAADPAHGNHGLRAERLPQSRVSDVAKEAGVAYGLVYHYFGSKEDLLETIFRRTWSRIFEAVEELEQSGVTAREQIAGVARIAATRTSKAPTSKPCTSDGRRGCPSSPVKTTETAPEQEETESPLTDSNRRPPPYHGGFGASRAYTRDHSRHSFSCKSA
jgi:hypothetical protein